MYFALETNHRVGLGQDFWPNSLDRDPFAQFLVFGLIYLSHPPAGDVADNAEPPSQQLRLRKFLGRSLGLKRKVAQHGCGKESSGLLMFVTQPVDLSPSLVIRAIFPQEYRALTGVQPQRGIEQSLNRFPLLGRYCHEIVSDLRGARLSPRSSPA